MATEKREKAMKAIVRRRNKALATELKAKPRRSNKGDVGQQDMTVEDAASYIQQTTLNQYQAVMEMAQKGASGEVTDFSDKYQKAVSILKSEPRFLFHCFLRYSAMIADYQRLTAELTTAKSERERNKIVKDLNNVALHHETGGEKTRNNAKEFSKNLEKYFEENSNQPDAKLVEYVCNTKPDSPAVTWKHGTDFKDRPWNAKNKQKNPYNVEQIRTRIRGLRMELSSRREQKYKRG